jgi:diacylglycerol kinase family enzyme
MERGLPHVCVPAGTRNHLALDLGVDRDDVVGALDAYGADGLERRIDLATINGRVFVNNASLGLYAKIVQSPEYRDAKGRTTLEMLPELIGPEAEQLDLRFAGPDGAAYDTAQVIQVSNDPYELHSLADFGTRDRIDLGVLGIMAIRIANAKEAGQLVTLQAAGQAQRFPGWLEWSARTFRIDSGGPVEVGVDGEAMKLDPPLLFESHPGALRVRVPRASLARRSPSTKVHILDRLTVTELARIAADRPARPA